MDWTHVKGDVKGGKIAWGKTFVFLVECTGLFVLGETLGRMKVSEVLVMQKVKLKVRKHNIKCWMAM